MSMTATPTRNVTNADNGAPADLGVDALSHIVRSLEASGPTSVTARTDPADGLPRVRVRQTASTPVGTEADMVDQAGMDSFPASDPPSFWTHDPAPRP